MPPIRLNEEAIPEGSEEGPIRGPLIDSDKDILESVARVTDASTAYANKNNYYIYFYYVPSGATPGQEKSLKFKALLTDFDDLYSSNWRDMEIYGRMDSVSTFQGTTRQINFGFDVVAGDLSEAKSNYDKSQTLLSFLYPVYEEAGSEIFTTTSIKAPPLLKIRFANLINEKVGKATLPLVGKLSGLAYKPTLDMGFFEDQGMLYPKVNSFSCNFAVFHTQDPQLSALNVRTKLHSPTIGTTRPIDEEGAFSSKLDDEGPKTENAAIQEQLNSTLNEISELSALKGEPA